MPAVAIRQTGEQYSPSGGRIPYKVIGGVDAASAAAAIADAAPATFGSLVLDWLNVSATLVSPVIDGGNDPVYEGEAPYLRYAEPETGDPPEFSYEISLESVREIFAKHGTVTRYARPGKIAPDYRGLMGVSRTGVEGIEIPRPIVKFNETYYLDSDSFDSEAYRAKLCKTVGKMNSVAFRGFSAREVLLLGASGSSRSRNNAQIQLTFGVSERVTNQTVGDITGITKEGWDVLDVSYTDKADDNDDSATDGGSATFTTIKIPEYVFIHRVFPEINFITHLGLPT